MKYRNIISIAAVTFLSTSVLSVAAEEVAVIDDEGDLRITLSSGVDREVTISGDDTDLNVSIVGLQNTNQNHQGFSGDIYIEADQDTNKNVLMFTDLDIAGSINVDLGQGDDSIRFIDSVVGGIDVRSRRGDDLIEVSDTMARGKVVIGGNRGQDIIEISGNMFMDDIRVRGGRDDDQFTVESNMFTGEVTRFNGRAGDDAITQAGNIPELTGANFRGLEAIVESSPEQDEDSWGTCPCVEEGGSWAGYFQSTRPVQPLPQFFDQTTASIVQDDPTFLMIDLDIPFDVARILVDDAGSGAVRCRVIAEITPNPAPLTFHFGFDEPAALTEAISGCRSGALQLFAQPTP